MAEIFQAIVIGVVQGLTEFLPISSSAHLIVLPRILGWDDTLINSAEFVVMLHMGTLAALLAYFWRDVIVLIRAAWAGLRERSLAGDPKRKLAVVLLLSVIPAALFGLFLEDWIDSFFRDSKLKPIPLRIPERRPDAYQIGIDRLISVEAFQEIEFALSEKLRSVVRTVQVGKTKARVDLRERRFLVQLHRGSVGPVDPVPTRQDDGVRFGLRLPPQRNDQFLRRAVFESKNEVDRHDDEVLVLELDGYTVCWALTFNPLVGQPPNCVIARARAAKPLVEEPAEVHAAHLFSHTFKITGCRMAVMPSVKVRPHEPVEQTVSDDVLEHSKEGCPF